MDTRIIRSLNGFGAHIKQHLHSFLVFMFGCEYSLSAACFAFLCVNNTWRRFYLLLCLIVFGLFKLRWRTDTNSRRWLKHICSACFNTNFNVWYRQHLTHRSRYSQSAAAHWKLNSVVHTFVETTIGNVLWIIFPRHVVDAHMLCTAHQNTRMWFERVFSWRRSRATAEWIIRSSMVSEKNEMPYAMMRCLGTEMSALVYLAISIESYNRRVNFICIFLTINCCGEKRKYASSKWKWSHIWMEHTKINCSSRNAVAPKPYHNPCH